MEDGTETLYTLNFKANSLGWHVNLEVSIHFPQFEPVFSNQKPKVEELVDNLNKAILNHQNLDISDYINYWKSIDKEFCYSLDGRDGASFFFSHDCCESYPPEFVW